MVTVKKSLPKGSLIASVKAKANYCDTISVVVPTVKTVDERQTEFSKITFPILDFLLKLRNVLVKPFNIKREKNFQSNFDDYYDVGEKAGFFTVVNRNDSEILMEDRDNHLNFFTSTSCENTTEGQIVTVATSVFYNNLTGRVYFFIVKPFHRLVIKALLKRIK